MSDPSSPSRSPSPTQNTRKTRSDFDLEPNPFEQSFSARPDSNLRNKHNTPTSERNSSHSPNNSSHSASPRPVLPPIAAISSPADPTYPWSFSSTSLGNSLRAGPLSPAMLAGPQQQNPDFHFDPSSFRTGLTPRSGMTPRSGLTPATGLTPLVGAGNAPFPPSPNTAALIALMNTNNPTTQTITPNTLNAISGALNPQQQQQQQHQQHHYQPSHLHNSHTQNSSQEDATTATSTAANGLFLLSQAHQELTKREQAQARATRHNNGNGNGTVNGIAKRNPKRKSYDPPLSPPPVHTQQRTSKRTRQASSTARRRSLTEDLDPDDDDDEDDMSAGGISDSGPTNHTRKSNKKPETEEEKRKNFLERNRQGSFLASSSYLIKLIYFSSRTEMSPTQKSVARVASS